LEIAAQGLWPVPIQAPEMDLACHNGGTSLGDFRGRPVRIVAAEEALAKKPIETVPGLTALIHCRAGIRWRM
jgi:hypothetical protein